MAKTKAIPLTATQFRCLLKVTTTLLGNWYIRIDLPSNAYSQLIDRKISEEDAKLKFVNTWYPAYLDDIGDYIDVVN